jgi:hypothetical protein
MVWGIRCGQWFANGEVWRTCKKLALEKVEIVLNFIESLGASRRMSFGCYGCVS